MGLSKKETELRDLVGVKISTGILLTDFLRLVDGDLEHIGNALLDGCDILVDDYPPSSPLVFSKPPSAYSIRLKHKPAYVNIYREGGHEVVGPGVYKSEADAQALRDAGTYIKTIEVVW